MKIRKAERSWLYRPRCEDRILENSVKSKSLESRNECISSSAKVRGGGGSKVVFEEQK